MDLSRIKSLQKELNGQEDIDLCVSCNSFMKDCMKANDYYICPACLQTHEERANEIEKDFIKKSLEREVFNGINISNNAFKGVHIKDYEKVINISSVTLKDSGDTVNIRYGTPFSNYLNIDIDLAELNDISEIFSDMAKAHIESLKYVDDMWGVLNGVEDNNILASLHSLLEDKIKRAKNKK